MAFDANAQLLKLVIINCGREIRRAKGLPEERNVTRLYEEASEMLGLPIIPISSREMNHSPAPHEMKNPDGTPSIPLRKCSQCGMEAMQLFGLCSSCEDAEGGKYKTLFECQVCHFKEKSEKQMLVWLRELGIEFGSQSKRSLGIKTVTDEGVK